MIIEHRLPSEILTDIIDFDKSIIELNLLGYGLHPTPNHSNVLCEYAYPDEMADIFLARIGSKVVGSLTIIKWLASESDERLARFFAKLKVTSPTITKAMADLNPLVCNIGGIVVHPNYQKNGIASSLITEFARLQKPTLIGGQTKTISAVMARRRLVSSGYRTFFGGIEVTDDTSPTNSLIHLPLYEAYRYARGEDSETPATYAHPYYFGGITSAIPDTSTCPVSVAAAFKPIIQAQRKVGIEGPIMMSFLLSVKNEILDP